MDASMFVKRQLVSRCLVYLNKCKGKRKPQFSRWLQIAWPVIGRLDGETQSELTTATCERLVHEAWEEARKTLEPPVDPAGAV